MDGSPRPTRRLTPERRTRTTSLQSGKVQTRGAPSFACYVATGTDWPMAEATIRFPNSRTGRSSPGLDDSRSSNCLRELIECILLLGSPGAATSLGLNTTSVTKHRARNFNKSVGTFDRQATDLARPPSLGSHVIWLAGFDRFGTVPDP